MCGDYDEKEEGSFRKKKQDICFCYFNVSFLQNVKEGKWKWNIKKEGKKEVGVLNCPDTASVVQMKPYLYEELCTEREREREEWVEFTFGQKE